MFEKDPGPETGPTLGRKKRDTNHKFWAHSKRAGGTAFALFCAWPRWTALNVGFVNESSFCGSPRQNLAEKKAPPTQTKPGLPGVVWTRVRSPSSLKLKRWHLVEMGAIKREQQNLMMSSGKKGLSKTWAFCYFFFYLQCWVEGEDVKFTL